MYNRISYFIFYVFLSLSVFIVTNFFSLFFSFILWKLFGLDSHSAYIIPVSSGYHIYELLQLIITFIAFLLLNRFLKQKYYIYLRDFIVAVITLTFFYHILILFICFIDVLYGCKSSDIIRIPAIINFFYYKILPFTIAYSLVFGLKNSSLPKKFLLVVLSTLFLCIYPLKKIYDSFYLLLHTANSELPILLRQDISDIKYKTYHIEDFGLSIALPADYKSNGDFSKESSPDTKFDYLYKIRLVDTAEVSSLTVSLLHYTNEQTGSSDIDAIDYCGSYTVLPGESRDFSEYCPSEASLKFGDNGLVYCETLNKNSQRLIERSKTKSAKVGAQVIEDRTRVFIALLPEPYRDEYCLKMQFNAEPKDTQNGNINLIGGYIMNSIIMPSE